MNWLDQAIGYLSPAAGARRLRGRVALEQMRQLAERLEGRAYEGAKSGRRTSGWTAAGTSANAEIAPALATLRNRCREQVRNNPYGAAAIARLTAKSIGTGIIARPDPAIRKVWQQFVEQCDFDEHFDMYGLQNLWARGSYEAGECLVRRIRVSDGIGLKLQTLEPDYIDTTRYGTVAGGNFVIAGIEIDRLGRKQAYWLWEQHPGDSNFLPKGLKSVRVPAADIIHIGEKLRPGQLRYVPRLAVSLIKMRDLDDFEEAELVRKKIEACYVAFVTGGNPDASLANEVVNDTSSGRRLETMSPGMIKYLADGTQVSFGNPTGTTDVAYGKRHLHAIAVGTGLSYELMTGDLTEVNFSSMRAGMQDFRDMVDSWRWLHFIPHACVRVERWFEEAAWTAGRIRSTGYEWKHTPPRWPYVDPLKDIQAAKEEMRACLSSLSENIRRTGEDPGEVLAEIKAERERLKADGIVSDADAAIAVGKGVAANPADTANEDGSGDGADTTDATAGKQAAGLEATRALVEAFREQGRAFIHAVENMPQPVTNLTLADGAVRAGDTHVHLPKPSLTERVPVRDDKGVILKTIEREIPE